MGDFVHLKHSNNNEGDIWHEGCVHHVYENHVSLRFGDDFSVYRGTKFDVRFVLNRLSIRRMHAVLINKREPLRILFPLPADLKTRARMSGRQLAAVRPVNRLIGEDEEQLEVVTAILNRAPGDVPFIVFGP